MKPSLEKIDDGVLALLHLTSFTEGTGEFIVTVPGRDGIGMHQQGWETVGWIDTSPLALSN